ncbi:uncharacterized protein LOC109841404 isoform X2 [Asparagus officinalis]|uniref:uncharacterized protein LOC109841404 isoform X2 n=1 Tax=Asparagus officinalis TaxID=4686 RepID=UPI00098E3259|nr:uncharacterized protein LOC109841404 isoform X2 [Asparagus officinalis]
MATFFILESHCSLGFSLGVVKYTIAMMGYGPEDRSAVLELTYNHVVKEYDKDNAYAQYTIAMMGYGPEDRSAVLELTYNHGVKEYDKDNAYAQLGEFKLGELLDSPPPGLDETIAISKVMQFVESQEYNIFSRIVCVWICTIMALMAKRGRHDIYSSGLHQAFEKYFIRMPNKWNFSFDYFYAAIIALGNYVPRSALDIVVNVFL